jgi:hypothetical protein
MKAHVTLIGINAIFSPDEIECLVRAAGDAVCGDRTDLTARQPGLAQRVHDVIHDVIHEVIHDAGRTDAGRSMPAAGLVALAQELHLDPRGLDDLVHDLASNSTSDINNGGLDTQIAHLLEQVGEAETEQADRNVVNRTQR